MSHEQAAKRMVSGEIRMTADVRGLAREYSRREFLKLGTAVAAAGMVLPGAFAGRRPETMGQTLRRKMRVK